MSVIIQHAIINIKRNISLTPWSTKESLYQGYSGITYYVVYRSEQGDKVPEKGQQSAPAPFGDNTAKDSGVYTPELFHLLVRVRSHTLVDVNTRNYEVHITIL